LEESKPAEVETSSNAAQSAAGQTRSWTEQTSVDTSLDAAQAAVEYRRVGAASLL
jgi:hypothetical protein